VQISNFRKDVLADYEAALEQFFDVATGGVLEPGRADGAPRFLFTEVTGYALLDFLTLHQLTGNDHYLALMKRSADWIRDHGQDSSGGILTRYYFEHDTRPDLAYTSFTGRRIYAFDTGICLRGMVAAYKTLRDPSYLDSAVRMAEFMRASMISASGEVQAIFDARQNSVVPADATVWSRAFGAFLTKVAEALVDLDEFAGDGSYRDLAIRICDAAIPFVAANGAIRTSEGRTELHPHCYATEGFLHVGRVTGEARFIDVAKRATEWALRQLVDGAIPQSFSFPDGKPLSRHRTDALAQVLALGSDLRQMSALEPSLEAGLDELAKAVLAQRQGSPGWYRYGFYERAFQGKETADTKSYWTQMFCLRGLNKYYQSWLVGNTCVAILAGGIGSRVWPISCENRPKPVSMSLLGDRSLLQETIRRFRNDHLFPSSSIYILCSRNALAQVIEQASAEGIPAENCVLETVPKGTIPAVNLALAGLPPASGSKERMVVISMADNVIEPYHRFQSALVAAPIAARENDTLVSIGRLVPEGTPRDDRFGHARFSRSVDGYRAYEVDHFVEKPDASAFEQLMALPGQLAWESGCVVFKENYYRSVVSPDAQSGNLAEHLLCKAAPWREQRADTVRVTTALMDPGVRFEDFGVPGQNMMSFYRDHPLYDRGHGNICVGTTDKVRLVACGNNLVISDELPIELYGLDGFVVIDNSVTNTTVLMKQEDVPHLPSLYRLFLGSKDYEAFVAGGPRAVQATPTTFVERSPNARSRCDFGLVFAFNFPEALTIERTRRGLRITNDLFPLLAAPDFDLFVEKQKSDPRLVEHLVRVGAVARLLASDELVLSGFGYEVLDCLCLYHAFGGFLTEADEARESDAIARFKAVSNLDARQLDSRIVQALIKTCGDDDSRGEGSDALLINRQVNSAVAWIEKRQPTQQRLRDVVAGLIHAQSNPSTYAAFAKSLPQIGYGDLADEVESIFACFKMAQHLCNGRWLWKRQLRGGAQGRSWLLEHDRGPLEEMAFIAAFSARWFQGAGIDPMPYLRRLNSLFTDQESLLNGLLLRMQNGSDEPCTDKLYRLLVSGATVTTCTLQEEALSMANSALDKDVDGRGWRQIVELPGHLEFLSAFIPGIDGTIAATIRESLLEIYHSRWRELRGRIPADLVVRLEAAQGV
jgi:mannose-1-phosphate guanylyltransferase